MFAKAFWEPRIWALRFSLSCKPAASSPARLMRKPEASFSMLFCSMVVLLPKWRCAVNELTLVLIIRGILKISFFHFVLFVIAWRHPFRFPQTGRRTGRGQFKFLLFQLTTLRITSRLSI